MATAIVVVVGIGAAFIASALSAAARPPVTAAAPAVAPAGPLDALAAAADALGFRQTTGADIGVVENMPADTTLLPPSKTVLPVGSVAPDFSLSTPTGLTMRLSDFKGKTVLLEFFATWCPHCQAEARHLLTLAPLLPAARFAILSVNADSEDPASLFAFDRFFGIPWPTLLDPGTPKGSYNQGGGAGPVTQAYGVAVYPTFYIIDAKGRIAWRGDREKPDALLLKEMRDASGS
jgi:thiol-disulfide isomerase/thioredoxin